MSVVNGFFTNDDSEVVKLSAVIAVEPLTGSNKGQFYEVITLGRYHFTVRDSYFSRADFITEWQKVT